MVIFEFKVTATRPFTTSLNRRLVDNLYITYESNMLVSVRDEASRLPYAGATDFDGVPGQEYPLTYNASGSLVSDARRGIARIDYDLNNNPVRIQFTNGSVTRYIYSAAGEKLRATHLTAVPNISVAIGSTRELIPSEIPSADTTDYLLGGSLTMRNGRIDKLQFDEGYCQATRYNNSQDNFTFYYYNRDHLGSIRQVTKADRITNGTVVQSMNYYPFGAQFCDGSTDSTVQPYKYNGKELDRMHGLNTYDYGERQYNPVTARWDRMDSLSEKYYSISPYAYCANNPVMYIDENGDSIIVDNYGNIMRQNGKDNNVFLFSADKNNYTKIGVLGGTINVQEILPNIFDKNAAEAKELRKSLLGVIFFAIKVKTDGDWDLKTNTKTIFGFKNSTKFQYNDNIMYSQDVGNMNFGVVAKAFGYSQEYAKRSAGLYQIWEGKSKKEWRSNISLITVYSANQFGYVSSVSYPTMGPPYGDDPRDQYWIDKGYQFK